MTKSFPRIALGILLALAVGAGACGGGKSDAKSAPAKSAGSGDQASDTAVDAPKDSKDAAGEKGGKPNIPKEVCDILSAGEVSAVVGTVTSKPGPQGSCSYDSEARDGLYPTIYLKDASEFVIKGLGEPLTIDGNPGYVSAVADAPNVQHGVLIKKGIYIEVVVNSTDLAAVTPKLKELLTLTASKL